MGENSDFDRMYMREALRLAAKGRGRTSPNPMVGAVLVQGNEIVGRGYHQRAGGPHAEVNAIRDAGDEAKGATLYVTLEPCNHQGRTPPCTLAVLNAGVRRVVAGMADPNPHVKGSGADYLRERGVMMQTGILERECRNLNQPFLKLVTTGMPYVTLKAAATLDGRIATRSGDSRWVSNERSRSFVHRLRRDLDAILIGIETALQDDPLLTARLPGTSAARQPIRVVLDSGLRIDQDSQLVKTAKEVPLFLACSKSASQEKAERLREAGAEVLRLPASEGRIDLPVLLRELGSRQVMSLLVEGGSRIHGAFIEAGLADDFYFFYAPKILGDGEGVPMVQAGCRQSMSDAFPARDIRVRRFGQDVMLSGRFREDLF